MSNLLYIVNKNSNPICRDSMIPYAVSVGLTYAESYYVNEDDLYDYNKIIIDSGWKDQEYIDFISKVVEYHSGNIIIRLVDDDPSVYTNFDLILRDLIKNNNLRLISPYEHKYFNYAFPDVVIPYHYDYDSEKLIEDRDYNCILSGFNDQSYKLRYDLYNIDYNKITKFSHPGYSGRDWKGKTGNDYISELSKYKFMIVTTAQDFELMKYVECAEAGCCPIGEFPSSLLRILPEEITKYHCTNAYEVISKLDRYMDNWKVDAFIYRDFMKKFRSKSVIRNLYEQL